MSSDRAEFDRVECPDCGKVHTPTTFVTMGGSCTECRFPIESEYPEVLG